MPRAAKRAVKKETSESSESDSGPEDRNPPAKKAKVAAAVEKKGTADEEPSWPLDKQRQIKVRRFKGTVYIDIREFYEKDGQMLPGRKGISLSVGQWQKLKNAIPEVDKAVEEI